jgi:Rad3-related DNA helicase
VQEIEGLEATLDPSQMAALRQALGSRVALIQGPPGTGKTYVGVQLCDILLRNTSETILCVCYTNHALDQFLEALLDKGVKDIVRIGGRSKSERLQPYNLKELVMQKRGQLVKSSASRRVGQVDEDATRCVSIACMLAFFPAASLSCLHHTAMLYWLHQNGLGSPLILKVQPTLRFYRSWVPLMA